jgi:hypothetical protein
MTIVASIENMKKFHKEPYTVESPNGPVTIMPTQPIAYSPATGDEYSANPGDYWNRQDSDILCDSEGNEMHLVFKRTVYVDIVTGEFL